MQLSILFATNRSGLLACSRIAQACSWASPDIEVIVRDNSGNAEKAKFLDHCRRDYCNIFIAEPCDILTNFSETLRLAKGEFVFVLADDDYCFDHAISDIVGLLKRVSKDPSVAGVTGAYVVETTKGSSVLTYQNVESDDVTARIAGFLSYAGPNILLYAPIRRDAVARVFEYVNAMPALFSFHDQVICLLYLLIGKFVRLNRLLYQYDIGPWENSDSAQKRDVDFYQGVGFDPAVNLLHWFICGFEGAVLARNATIFPNYTLAQRQVIADVWFSTMYGRFKGHKRINFESRFTGEAEKLRDKWLQLSGRLSFPDLLKDLCGFIALFSPEKSKLYFEFWDAVINRRNPLERPAGGRAAIET